MYGASVWAVAFLMSGSLAVDGAWAGEDQDDADGEKKVVRKVIVVGDDHQVEIEGDDLALHGMGRHHGFGHFGGGGFLGVRLTDLTSELRVHFGVPDDQGVLVGQVVADSPAERAGVQVGDIITAVDGEAIASGGALAHAIHRREEGDTVDLEVWRDGRLETLSAAVEERQPHRMARKIRIRCAEGEEDCEALHMKHDFDFDLDVDCDDCEVRVECKDGDCTCEVDGEEADCAELGVGAKGD
jgi:hypothetical protein